MWCKDRWLARCLSAALSGCGNREWSSDVGLCSNTMTDEQATKIARWAHELGGGLATVMLDCDEEGDKGSRQAVYELAQRCKVRLAWTRTMLGGRFSGRQPESLTAEECVLLWGDKRGG